MVDLEEALAVLADASACPDRGRPEPWPGGPDSWGCLRGFGPDGTVTMEQCVACRYAARTGADLAAVFPDAEPRRAAAGLVARLVRPEPWEDLAWLVRWAAAGKDPGADVRRYAGPPGPEPQPVPIAVWVHAGILGTWEPILRELLSAVMRGGLAASSTSVNLCTVGPPVDLSWLPPWVTVVGRDGPLELGENSTLRAMWDWSRAAPPHKVCYLHTKGASHGRNPNVTAWRQFLTWANVLEWRRCAAALDSHDAAGVDYQAEDTAAFRSLWSASIGPGRAGFVGNFWHGRSDFLATLPPDRVRLNDHRWNAEFDFIGMGRPRVRCFHRSETHHYTSPYPRSAYDPGPP